MTITDAQRSAAAGSFVLADGATRQLYLDTYGHLPPADVVRAFTAWTHVPGLAHTVGDLALLALDFQNADGDYATLLARGAGVNPNLFGANVLSALMTCRGNFEDVTRTLMEALEGVHAYYVDTLGADGNAQTLADAVQSLRTGPLPDGGFFPAGHWDD